jgi:hypothetical protein
MKRFLLGAFIFSFIALTISNCKHEIPEPVVEEDVFISPIPTLSDTCSFDTIYFVKEILPIFQTQCATSGCHDENSAADGIILNNYVDIIKTGEIKAFDINNGGIYKSITEADVDKIMPPGASLTPEQINAIKVWINQGALNNDCRNKCFSDSFSFSKEIWPIIDGSCAGCHRGSNPFGGVSLTSYNQIKINVDNGRFLAAILHQSGVKPMPPGGSLDSCSIEKVKKWVAAGAPNN